MLSVHCAELDALVVLGVVYGWFAVLWHIKICLVLP